MRRIGKFFAFSRAERRLLAKAFVTVGSIRVGLWLLPFRILRPLLERTTRIPDRPNNIAGEITVDRVAWAVSAAAHYIPRASCLTQALAAQTLLAEQGEMTDLHFGVARDEHLGVVGHAWLESRGRVVIGGRELDRYIPLSLLGNWKDVSRRRQLNERR